jgi:hypothetical protein
MDLRKSFIFRNGDANRLGGPVGGLDLAIARDDDNARTSDDDILEMLLAG